MDSVLTGQPYRAGRTEKGAVGRTCRFAALLLSRWPVCFRVWWDKTPWKRNWSPRHRPRAVIRLTMLFLAGSRIGKHHKTGWIIAGACVFLGFAAALLSDGPEALAQFERMQAYGMASAAN